MFGCKDGVILFQQYQRSQEHSNGKYKIAHMYNMKVNNDTD